jgi:hypothetical protein
MNPSAASASHYSPRRRWLVNALELTLPSCILRNDSPLSICCTNRSSSRRSYVAVVIVVVPRCVIFPLYDLWCSKLLRLRWTKLSTPNDQDQREHNRSDVTFRAYHRFPNVMTLRLNTCDTPLTTVIHSSRGNISEHFFWAGRTPTQTSIPLLLPLQAKIQLSSGRPLSAHQPLPDALDPTPAPLGSGLETRSITPVGNGFRRALLMWHEPLTDENTIRNFRELTDVLHRHNVYHSCNTSHLQAPMSGITGCTSS